METNKPELTGLFRKILKGMNQATRKLITTGEVMGGDNRCWFVQR